MSSAFHLRRATEADLATILPMTLGLNAHEGIHVAPGALATALAVLLQDRSIGGVWLVVDLLDAVVGYALVSYSYDLEFAGREGWLTELWIEEQARARGAGSAALALLESDLRGEGVRALHLQVRPDNPARRLYERNGFVASPRIVMTRRL